MKWQDFYFNWLQQIGFYQWFNATLNGNKNDIAVGSASNIGSVGFQKNDAEPNVPEYQHPAQELIETALQNTDVLPAQNNGPLRRMRNRGQSYTNNAMAYLRGSEFGEGQKNTLRYWGVQPQGVGFDSQSNVYRGYSYYTEAMKQKVVLRTQRGGVIKKDKDWLVDKDGRTYPTTRRPSNAQMVTVQHPDYQKWADVGNVMQINWGAMNGFNAITYDPTRDYEPTVVFNESGTLTYSGTQDDAGDWTITNSDEYDATLVQYIKSGEDIHIRTKAFDETYYAHDKVMYDATKQIAEILIREKPNITVATAEVIQYILSPQYLTNWFGYESTNGNFTLPFTETFVEKMATFPLSQQAILEIIQLNSLIDDGSTDVRGFLNFPMSPLLFTLPVMQQNSEASQVTMGGRTFTIQQGPTQKMTPALRRNSWNNPVAGGLQSFMGQMYEENCVLLREMWESFELCDEELLTWLTSHFDSPSWRGEYAEKYEPLFCLPSWANPNYAAAIGRQVTNDETNWQAPNNSLDWLPRDIAFVVNENMPRYLYEIPLSEWMQNYGGEGPQTQDLKYWEIDSTFLHINSKKQRGRTDPTITDLHIIQLKPLPSGRAADGSIIMDRGLKNNIGISELTATADDLQGRIDADSLPQAIYTFWDRSHSWPLEVPIPNGTDNMGNNRGQKSKQVAPLHSMLSAMDETDTWWNDFLSPTTGILSMNSNDENPLMWPGWRLGWNYCYMENIIWRNRLSSSPSEWTNDLTLESFCEKVFPSTNMVVKYFPKIEGGGAAYTTEDGTVWADMSLDQQAETIVRQSDEGNIPFSSPTLTYTNNLSRQGPKSIDPTFVSAVLHSRKLPRLNLAANVSQMNWNIVPVNRASHAITNRNYMAYGGLQGREARRSEMNDYQESNWGVTYYPVTPWASVRGRQIQDGEYEFTNKGNMEIGLGNQVVLMEDDATNIAVLPNIKAMSSVGNSEEWAIEMQNTGYNRASWGWDGSLISFLYSANGGTVPEIDFNTAKKVILSDLPTDIYQMETYTNLSSRNIDYTAPSGNPWRRGKIPMINWAAILSPKLLTMLTSED